MPYLSHVAITWSSRTEPPACAMYSTPLLWARSMLSPKGKKASDPKATQDLATWESLQLLDINFRYL